MKSLSGIVLCIVLALFGGESAASQALPIAEAQQVFCGVAMDRPVFIAALPGVPGRWVVAEQRGRVLLIDSSGEGVLSSVMLDLTHAVPNYADRGRDQLGLLGLAFDPSFTENRRVFLHYTAPLPRRSVVSCWQVGGDGVIDPASEVVLMQVRQPYATNNGGGIVFGPDGYLYIGIGDGGAAARDYAQDRSTLLGKVLRIDVDGEDRRRGLGYAIPANNPFVGEDGSRPEVYAYGLSNPWRFSFDRENGDLWLGDVGESSWEEINRIVNGGNYGWPWREGGHAFGKPQPGEVLPEGLIDPVFEYPHTEGKAVVGGYVYRGKAFPELKGHYVYADYVSGKVWALELGDNDEVIASRYLLTVPHPASFAEDADGELLICSFGADPGKPEDDGVYRIVPLGP